MDLYSGCSQEQGSRGAACPDVLLSLPSLSWYCRAPGCEDPKPGSSLISSLSALLPLLISYSLPQIPSSLAPRLVQGSIVSWLPEYNGFFTGPALHLPSSFPSWQSPVGLAQPTLLLCLYPHPDLLQPHSNMPPSGLPQGLCTYHGLCPDHSSLSSLYCSCFHSGLCSHIPPFRSPS